MLRKMAIIFGVVFLAIGIMGFIPAFTPDGNLLGIFHVNAAHNIIHLASGAAALLTSAIQVICYRKTNERTA